MMPSNADPLPQTDDRVRKGRILGLDIVRAAAILCVLTAHFCSILHLTPRIQSVLSGLAGLGVELFFVLSGFLIGGILLRGAARNGFALRDVVTFWKRRWYRTLPNYMACLAAVIIVTWMMGSPWHDSLWLHCLFLQNLVVYRAGVLFGPSWSLSVEEWMYLLLPIVFAGFALSRKTTIERSALFATALLCIVPTALRLGIALPREFSTGIRKIVIFRLDAIGYGVALAYLDTFRQPIMERVATARNALIGLVALILVQLSLVSHAHAHETMYTPWPKSLWSNCFWFTACSLSIVPIVAYMSTVYTARSRMFAAGCTTVSKYSYSLYLWHFPFLMVLDRYAYRYHGAMRRPVEFVVLILGSSLISYCAYRWIEAPGMAMRERARAV